MKRIQHLEPELQQQRREIKNCGKLTKKRQRPTAKIKKRIHGKNVLMLMKIN